MIFSKSAGPLVIFSKSEEPQVIFSKGEEPQVIFSKSEGHLVIFSMEAVDPDLVAGCSSARYHSYLSSASQDTGNKGSRVAYVYMNPKQLL